MTLPTSVNPGDLIRAELMTDILGKLVSLDQRISSLEATSPTTIGLLITTIIPGGPIRVNEEMQVLGQNFGVSIGAHRVFIDGTRVLNFKSGTTDQKLVFDVPDVPNVPQAGKPAVMSVSNQTQTELRTINLLPMQIPLGGNVDITYQSVQPTTIVAGGAATFRYKVRSRANQQTQFTLSGTVSGVPNAADWQNQVRILNDDNSENAARTITLAPLQEAFFKVRINVVPATPATFTLTANAGATGVVSTPAGRSFTIGQANEDPDPSTSFNFQSAIPPAAFAGGTLTLAKGASSQISLLASFTTPGFFRVTHGVTQGTGWTTVPALGTPTVDFEVKAEDLSPPRVYPFIVTATAAASATGKAEFRLERLVGGLGSASGPKQIFPISLVAT